MVTLMERTIRTITCDHPGCKSYCELGPLVTPETLFKNLADRGWQTVLEDDEKPKHFCQAHRQKQSPLIPDAKSIEG